MNKWTTRLFALLMLVLVFGVGYSFIVTQETNIRDQPLHKDTTSINSSLGTLLFEIDDTNSNALSASTFTLQLLPAIDSADSKLSQLDNNTTLPAQTSVSVKLNMLTMDCGTIQFSMSHDEYGNYYGEGIPVMSGQWVATATVTYEGQPQDEAIYLAFTFDVK